MQLVCSKDLHWLIHLLWLWNRHSFLISWTASVHKEESQKISHRCSLKSTWGTLKLKMLMPKLTSFGTKAFLILFAWSSNMSPFYQKSSLGAKRKLSEGYLDSARLWKQFVEIFSFTSLLITAETFLTGLWVSYGFRSSSLTGKYEENQNTSHCCV